MKTKSNVILLTYLLLCACGSGIKPGSHLPGGFTVLATQPLSSVSECLSAAKTDVATRKNVQSVTEDDKSQNHYAAVIVTLKSGGSLLYACMERSQTRTDYVLSGKGPEAVE